MKKVFYALVLCTTSLFLTNNASAQAFEKGNINLDLGIGLGAYSTETVITSAAIDLGFIVIPPTTVVDKDGAASTMVPLIFEYGISNKVGLGIQLGMSNYFIDNEDSTEITESVRSADFGIFCNYHLLESDKNDLFIGIGLGGSSVNWKNLNDEEWTGSGSYFSFYVKDRLFFNDNVGILFNLGYTVYRYSNLESSINNPFITEFTWDLRGINIGTGLAVKF